MTCDGQRDAALLAERRSAHLPGLFDHHHCGSLKPPKVKGNLNADTSILSFPMSSSSSLVISDPSSRPPSLAAEPAPWNSLLTPHTTALSYIDREADDPKWRSRVAAEIAAETKRDPSFRAEVDQKIEKTLGPSYDWNHSTTRVRTHSSAPHVPTRWGSLDHDGIWTLTYIGFSYHKIHALI